jgi:hypothetical protein
MENDIRSIPLDPISLPRLPYACAKAREPGFVGETQTETLQRNACIQALSSP